MFIVYWHCVCLLNERSTHTIDMFHDVKKLVKANNSDPLNEICHLEACQTIRLTFAEAKMSKQVSVSNRTGSSSHLYEFSACRLGTWLHNQVQHGNA